MSNGGGRLFHDTSFVVVNPARGDALAKGATAVRHLSKVFPEVRRSVCSCVTQESATSDK